MQIVTNKSQKELKEHGSYQFPILVSRECLSGYETGSFFWHWHPEVELTLVTEGVIEYHVNGSVFILKEISTERLILKYENYSTLILSLAYSSASPISSLRERFVFLAKSS